MGIIVGKRWGRDALLTRIQEIIKNESVEIKMQIVISPNNDYSTAVEAFSRGIDADGNYIPPLKLIYEASKHGLLYELEELMLRKTLDAFRTIFLDNPNTLLFINIDSDFMEICLESDVIDRMVLAYGIPVSNIFFDIVSFDFGRLRTIKEFVDMYRRKGYYICIDDIGKDYQNIDKILYLGPDAVKVNISPLRQLENQVYVEGMLKVLKGIAEALGIIIVAKGIEDESDITYALHSGAQFMQGYFISKPTDLKPDFFKTLKHRYQTLMEEHVVEEETQLELTRSMTSKAYAKMNEIKSFIIDQMKQNGKIDEMLIFQKFKLIENLWVLDENGIQYGPTFINSEAYKTKNISMFQIFQHGSDFSTKDVFTQLESGILDVWVTTPHQSVLTQNICIGASTKLNLSEQFFVLGVNLNLDKLLEEVRPVGKKIFEEEEMPQIKVIQNE